MRLWKQVQGVSPRWATSAPIAPLVARLAETLICLCVFKILLFYLERGKVRRKRGRETSMWERNINMLTLACTTTEDQARALSQPRHVPCPELNGYPFTFQDDAQATEPHKSEQGFFFNVLIKFTFFFFSYYSWIIQSNSLSIKNCLHMSIFDKNCSRKSPW